MTDPHVRFGTWVAGGARGEPPRDLAVHASVCADCQRMIVAYDRLAAVNPARAAQVPPRRSRDVGGALIGAGRVASALAGVVIVAAVVGLGAAQLVDAMRGAPANGEVAVATDTPEQQVGAGNATPRPTPGFSVTATPEASGPSGSGDAFGTPLPLPELRPADAPGDTAPPTPVPTAVPTPIETPSPTPTPTPTPAPTIPDAPVLTASAGTLPGTIELSWATLSNGGSSITFYEVYRDLVLLTTVTTDLLTATFTDTDTNLVSGQEYSYSVVAWNSIGPSASSTTASFTLP
jgi:hypothetical protein